MTRCRDAVLVVLSLVLLCAPRSIAAPATQPSADATSFMRFSQDDAGRARLEVADVAYRNDAAGVTVHLIGAVHVADPEFYAGLNESFRHYDALLYEMVKPKGAEPPGGPQSAAVDHDEVGGAHASSGHWIGTTQRLIQEKLKLAYQLDGINYRAKNFVHADLDWETFSQMQDERGESFVTLFVRSAAHGLARAAAGKPEAGTSDVDELALLGALTSRDSARELKRVLARQFASSDEALLAMEGKQGSVLLAERNKACFRVLHEQIAARKKFLGIFYGAGHLKLMEQMLRDMGYTKLDTVWRTAWDIPPSAMPTTTPATTSIGR